MKGSPGPVLLISVLLKAYVGGIGVERKSACPSDACPPHVVGSEENEAKQCEARSVKCRFGVSHQCEAMVWP